MISDIARLCAEKNISYSQLAKECGVSVAYISLIQHGKRKNISFDVLKRIAQNLEVSVTELLDDVPCTTGHTLDYDPVWAVLKAWDVAPAQHRQLEKFLSGLDANALEPILKFFHGYEAKIVGKILDIDYSPHQVKALLAAALHSGRIETWLALRLLGQPVAGDSDLSQILVPDPLFDPASDPTSAPESQVLALTIQPKYLLDKYGRQIPDLLNELLPLYQTRLGHSEAFLYVGNLCLKNGLNKLALDYFGDGILCAFVEEKNPLLLELLHTVRSLPPSPLKELIIAWYDGSTMCAREGKYEQALALQEQALRIRTKSQTEQRFKARLYSNVGTIYLMQAKYKESLAKYKESIRLWPEGPLADSTYVNIGILMRRTGKLEEAKRYYELAINSTESYVKPRALHNLAYLCLTTKDYNRSRQLTLEGYLTAKQRKREQGKTVALVNLGLYHRETGNYRYALYLLDLAAKRALRHKEHQQMCDALTEMAATYRQTDRLAEAEAVLARMPK